MKKIIAIFGLLSISSTVFASDSDINISGCAKNPSALYVEISGPSAYKIYANTAQRLGIGMSDLGGGTKTNDMNCRPTGMTAEGNPVSVVCSFVMVDGKNIAFPQVDSGFSHQPIIECNDNISSSVPDAANDSNVVQGNAAKQLGASNQAAANDVEKTDTSAK